MTHKYIYMDRGGAVVEDIIAKWDVAIWNYNHGTTVLYMLDAYSPKSLLITMILSLLFNLKRAKAQVI